MLRGMETPVTISAILDKGDKGDNFCDFLFALPCTSPLLKRGLL